MRGHVLVLGAAGLLLGQVVVAGGAQAVSAVPSGTRHTAASTSSVNLSIEGVSKARVKVRGAGVRQVVRSSTILRLPVGSYRISAYKVLQSGTSYKPERRVYRVRATSGRITLIAVQYVPVSKHASPAGLQGSTPDGPVAEMFALINKARSQSQRCGSTTMPAVPPLVYNSDIAQAAQKHAEDMARNNYFDHDSLDGRTFVDRINATGYRGDPGGENIASGFPTAQETLTGWLDSPGHCRNLMSRFDHTGLGFAVRADAKYSAPVTYWVQDFGFSNN